VSNLFSSFVSVALTISCCLWAMADGNRVYSSSEEDGSSCIKDTERCLWEKCNSLLQSDKKLTKSYILSTMIHTTVLILVTISVRRLSKDT